jgi:hypothetical protein
MSDETGDETERRPLTAGRLPGPDLPLLVRLPYEVAAWIEKEAVRNCASRNSEIIRSIRARMDAEPKRAG